jgi:hypothetical protein
MKELGNRREFIKRAASAAVAPGLIQAVTAGGVFGFTRASLSTASKQTAPLPRPRFYWGVGIENCWIAQTNPQKDGNRRLLDVYLQMQHYTKWKSDLDLAKDIGFNVIRYSVPWYKAEPKPGIYDWSWIDKPVEYMVGKLKIIPIMDLIHYGTPTWMESGVIDDRFPEAIAKYASAMANHFKGLVNHYSPHNEPQVTCESCGLTGEWPPYAKSMEAWAKIGINVAKGIDLEMQSIREAIPDAVIVSVEADLYDSDPCRYMEQHLRSEDDGNHAESTMAAAFYPSSLAYGMVKSDHPFAHFLNDHGVTADQIEWFAKHSARPDDLGTNYYPNIEKLSKTGANGMPLDKAATEATSIVRNALTRAQSYFNLPVYLTETSTGLTTEAKIAYINALYDMVLALRKENFPLVGINWWPLFETIRWSYREKVDKPLTDFLIPGSWNNGLYVIKAEPDGDLRRVRTDAAGAYQAIIRKDASSKAA